MMSSHYLKRRQQMQDLIQTLRKALIHSDDFINKLPSEGELYFNVNHPVAVVHHEKRLKEEEIVGCLKAEGFLDIDGYTPHNYTSEHINSFFICAQNYVKKVSLLCTSSKAQINYIFKEKRAGDYWKKIINPGNFKAVIEYSQYNTGEDICKIEFELRELMRSSKEVPSLKVLPYVWVVKVSKEIDISKIMQHYFNDNYELLKSNDTVMAMGWSDTLQDVNMRYFVCPPS